MTFKQFSTQATILTRTDFGEADRILNFITPDHGKVKVLAKGVRKAKAKLAGAVELFSVTDITFVAGRGEIGTLTGARLVRHYGNIIKDIERTNCAYELLRLTDRSTEDRAESGYFDLLQDGLTALNDTSIDTELTRLWFKMQLLKLAGHSPNLNSDEFRQKLVLAKKYSFDYDKMHFTPNKAGEYNSNHIKFLRLGFGVNRPLALQRVKEIEKLVSVTQTLVDTILKTYIRI